MDKGLPRLSHVDHVGLTVPDLDAAVRFYCDAIGGHELYRLGPFDATEMPRMGDGRDWAEAHINVAGARLTIAMLSIGPNLMLELFQYDRPAGRREQPPRNCDFGGHHVAFGKSRSREELSRQPRLYGDGWAHRPRPGALRHHTRQLRARSLGQSARTGRIHNSGV
jgi:catechol 2,3-dioxygenase-like lactoylglutathione lyase family enzyme